MTAVVIGAGPAGMATASVIADAGLSVTLIDRYPRPGGQIGRQPVQDRTHSGPFENQVSSMLADPGISVVVGTTVMAVERNGANWRLLTETDGRLATIEAQAVVLATGSREIVIPFPGWDLPGVMSAGAVQAYLKSNGTIPWGRVALAGTGPLLLAVGATLRSRGFRPVSQTERRTLTEIIASSARHPLGALSKSAEFIGLMGRCRPSLGWEVEGATGVEQIESVSLRRGTRTKRVDVDVLAVSDGLVPDVGLAVSFGCELDGEPLRVKVDRTMATSMEGVFAAGEVAGVSGHHAAAAEGRMAGAGVVGLLSGHLHPDVEVFGRAVRRSRSLESTLASAFPIPRAWSVGLPPDTVICRCEEVPIGEIRSAIESGASDVRTIKGFTRAGMGRCQGAVCGPLLRHLVESGPGDHLENRTIGTPVTLSELARLEPTEDPGRTPF